MKVNIEKRLTTINESLRHEGIKIVNRCTNSVILFDGNNNRSSNIQVHFSGITGKEVFQLVIYQVYLTDKDIDEHISRIKTIGLQVKKLNELLKDIRQRGY